MKKVLVMVLAAAFMLAMYVPASAGTAADWDLYGHARMTTFWTDYSEERGDETTLNHDLQSNARLGGTVQHGAIGGGFEFGVDDDIGVWTRKLYGTVDMGQGQLLIGQNYAPYGAGAFISTQAYNADENMLMFLGYTSRKPMIQYSVNNFKIALVEPQTASASVDVDTEEEITFADGTKHTIVGTEEKAVDGDPEIQLPQLQASYDLNFDGFSINMAGLYQTYELQGGVGVDDGQDLDAYGLSANARFNMMDPVYFNLGGFYAENAGNFGQWNTRFTDKAQFDDNGEIEDTESFGGVLVVGTSVDNIGLEAGIGYAESDNDLWEDNQEVLGTYGQVNVPLTANGNAFIVPEIGYYDYEQGDDDLGDELYAGLKWQVNF